MVKIDGSGYISKSRKAYLNLLIPFSGPKVHTDKGILSSDSGVVAGVLDQDKIVTRN